jgi:hypothetical protein
MGDMANLVWSSREVGSVGREDEVDSWGWSWGVDDVMVFDGEERSVRAVEALGDVGAQGHWDD